MEKRRKSSPTHPRVVGVCNPIQSNSVQPNQYPTIVQSQPATTLPPSPTPTPHHTTKKLRSIKTNSPSPPNHSMKQTVPPPTSQAPIAPNLPPSRIPSPNPFRQPISQLNRQTLRRHLHALRRNLFCLHPFRRNLRRHPLRLHPSHSQPKIALFTDGRGDAFLGFLRDPVA